MSTAAINLDFLWPSEDDGMTVDTLYAFVDALRKLEVHSDAPLVGIYSENDDFLGVRVPLTSDEIDEEPAVEPAVEPAIAIDGSRLKFKVPDYVLGDHRAERESTALDRLFPPGMRDPRLLRNPSDSTDPQ